ncbi:uncharacterized protein LOC144111059 isoform X1 [Amblyomma americanum]
MMVTEGEPIAKQPRPGEWLCSMAAVAASAAVDLRAREPLFPTRKQREFIPDNKKDDTYWDRRRRNNEAAKRSREKRRLNDMVLETRVLELAKENAVLRAELAALSAQNPPKINVSPLRDKFGIRGSLVVEQAPQQHPADIAAATHVPVPVPVPAAGLTDLRGRRNKLLSALLPALVPQSPASASAPQALTTSPTPYVTSLAQQQQQQQHQQHQPHHNHHHQNQNHHHQQLTQQLNGQHQPALLCAAPPPALDDHRTAATDQESSPLSSGSWSSAEDSPPAHHFSLPHKLRHKWHISGSEGGVVAPPGSGAAVVITASAMVSSNGTVNGSNGSSGGLSSPELRSSSSSFHGREDTASSDGDSGASSTDAPSPRRDESSRKSRNGSAAGHHHHHHRSAHSRLDLQTENFQLRSEMQRLAAEVANLRDMMMSGGPSPHNGAPPPPHLHPLQAGPGGELHAPDHPPHLQPPPHLQHLQAMQQLTSPSHMHHHHNGGSSNGRGRADENRSPPVVSNGTPAPSMNGSREDNPSH